MSEPKSLQEFMALALAMENEAVERYTDFADTMETHNNREVAALFRRMAGYEAKHAAQIMYQMNWTEAPPVPPGAAEWPDLEGPETVPHDQVHYLMQPWHVLQLALAAEQRAEKFFAQIATVATDESVRRAALELQAEEAGHVALVKSWLDKVPPPDRNWAEDPDPPRYID